MPWRLLKAGPGRISLASSIGLAFALSLLPLLLLMTSFSYRANSRTSGPGLAPTA